MDFIAAQIEHVGFGQVVLLDHGHVDQAVVARGWVGGVLRADAEVDGGDVPFVDAQVVHDVELAGK